MPGQVQPPSAVGALSNGVHPAPSFAPHLDEVTWKKANSVSIRLRACTAEAPTFIREASSAVCRALEENRFPDRGDLARLVVYLLGQVESIEDDRTSKSRSQLSTLLFLPRPEAVGLPALPTPPVVKSSRPAHTPPSTRKKFILGGTTEFHPPVSRVVPSPRKPSKGRVGIPDLLPEGFSVAAPPSPPVVDAVMAQCRAAGFSVSGTWVEDPAGRCLFFPWESL